MNWLNISQGFSPAYKYFYQPGSIGYDPNSNLLRWNAGEAGFDSANVFRNRLAKYFLPGVHEWHKAAYFDPITGVYYDYPTGSDSAPTAVASGTAAGTAVYKQPLLSGPAEITLAGGLSPYGTMGQAGNAIEWDETDGDLVNDSPTSFRGLRGAAWYDSFGLAAPSRTTNPPTGGGFNTGFRVASTIPEPSTLILLSIATWTALASTHIRRLR